MSRTLRLAVVLVFSLFFTSCDSKKPDATGGGGSAGGAPATGGSQGGTASAQPTIKPPAMLDLVPEGAVGIVYIPSLSGAEEAAKRLVATGSPDEARNVKLAEIAAMQGLDPADLDMSRGAAVAMVLAKDPQEPPGVTSIVPVKDEKAVAAKVKADRPGAAVETAGGFAAISPRGAYKK